MSGAGHETALLVRMPHAVPAVENCRRQFDPAARQAMPPHVTVLYPFVPQDRYLEVRAALAGVLAEHEPFDYSLVAVRSFPGVIFLAPEPVAPFVHLTESVAGRFGLAPYDGRFETVVPHLTVALRRRRLPRRHELALRASLPIPSTATSVEVLADTGGHWALVDSVPLGGR